VTPSRRRSAGIVVALATLITTMPSSPASAQVAGAVSASFVYADGDAGGAAMIDVWAPIDVVRIGGFFGVGALLADRDERNRVMMPVGASVGLFFGDDVTFSLRARGGLWGGATQETKLTVGGFFGGGAGIGLRLSPEVSASAVLEVWGILGAGETWAVAPGLSLEWGHPVPAPPDDEEDDLDSMGAP
jgi:hypothetical protein